MMPTVDVKKGETAERCTCGWRLPSTVLPVWRYPLPKRAEFVIPEAVAVLLCPQCGAGRKTRRFRSGEDARWLRAMQREKRES